jgi:hypothetical protein
MWISNYEVVYQLPLALANGRGQYLFPRALAQEGLGLKSPLRSVASSIRWLKPTAIDFTVELI